MIRMWSKPARKKSIREAAKPKVNTHWENGSTVRGDRPETPSTELTKSVKELNFNNKEIKSNENEIEKEETNEESNEEAPLQRKASSRKSVRKLTKPYNVIKASSYIRSIPDIEYRNFTVIQRQHPCQTILFHTKIVSTQYQSCLAKILTSCLQKVRFKVIIKSKNF